MVNIAVSGSALIVPSPRTEIIEAMVDAGSDDDDAMTTGTRKRSTKMETDWTKEMMEIEFVRPLLRSPISIASYYCQTDNWFYNVLVTLE